MGRKERQPSEEGAFGRGNVTAAKRTETVAPRRSAVSSVTEEPNNTGTNSQFYLHQSVKYF